MPYYSLDIYNRGNQQWSNWTESSSYSKIKEEWHKLIEEGKVARIRKVEDLTSGIRCID